MTVAIGRESHVAGPSAYLVVVGALATAGFATGQTLLVLAAALLALPSSLLSIPAFYLSYGMLTLLPGATSSHSSGSGWCTADGACHGTSAGDPSAWFTYADGVLGVLALVGAASVDVVALRVIVAHRKARH